MARYLLTACLVLGASAALADGAPHLGKPRADYILHCAGCHGMTGEGTVQGGVPPFPGSVGHIAGSDIGRSYIMHVPGVISTGMNDAEIAEVLNYILDNWGQGAEPFTAQEVTRRRAIEIGDVVAYRREVVADLRRAGIEIAEYPWP